MGPSRSNHPNNDIETEIRHPFTTAESALKFLTYRALFLCKTLYLQYLKLVARNWKSQGDRGAEIRGPLYPGLVFKKKMISSLHREVVERLHRWKSGHKTNREDI